MRTSQFLAVNTKFFENQSIFFAEAQTNLIKHLFYIV